MSETTEMNNTENVEPVSNEVPEDKVEEETKPTDIKPVLSVAEGDTKSDIRIKVWKYLETNNLAVFPRPVKNRIPNFKGSTAACDRAADLDVFKKANTVKINPDKPQEQARFRTLEAEKTLLVPTPRLRKGLFNKIVPPDTKKATLRYCSTSRGVRQYSTPLGLDMKVKVDLVVIGSVAVSTSGLRIGKGEGFADLEYGMMASVGAVDENTMVVTTVHDCQLMDLPEELFGEHDVTIDYICTPTRVIECSRRPKPRGIIWSLLGLEKFKQIPILKVLRDQESAEGKNVSLKDNVTEEELEAALAAASQEEQEQEREGPLRRRNRRFGPRRRSGEGESRQMMNGDGMDGDEHADGEGSPPGDSRKRQNSYRRRKLRNRRRRSERQSSDGERSSPLHDEDEAEVEGDERRRRRPGRFRRQRDSSKTETASGEDNDQQDGKMSPYGGTDGQRKPYRNRRPRRRSEGSKDYDSGQHDSDQQDRRAPRRFARRPRYNNRRDGEGSGDSPGQNKGGSPGGYRYLVGRRPRKRNYLPSVYVGSLPKTLRVSDFKKQIRDKDVRPLRVLWRGTNGHVFLIFQTMDETEDTLRKLENLSINDKEVKVALANHTERKRKTATPDGSGQDDESKYDDQSAARSESSDGRAANFRQDNEVIS